MKRIGNLGLLLIVLSMMVGSGAHATPMLRITDDSAALVTVTDNGVGDINSVFGVIVFAGMVGINWSGSAAGFTKPSIGTGSQPQMQLLVSFTSSAVGFLSIEFSETGFGPAPAGTVFNDAIAGGMTGGGNVTALQSYDVQNRDFGIGPTISVLGPFTGASFSGSDTSDPIADPDLYSLEMTAFINHSTAGRTFLDYTKEYAAPIPEPTTLALLAVGLAGIGWGRRKSTQA